MRNEKNYNGKEKKKKSLEDYEHCIGSRKQVYDFEVTINCIIDHAQDHFDRGHDVTASLRIFTDLVSYEWIPTVQASEAEEEAVRDRENRYLELGYKGESADHHKRVREHEK